MRVKEAGLIDNGLWLLGTKESCVYLLEGTQSAALISAGLSYILPELLRQILSTGVSERKIEHLIILHAHFDHVGIVPFMRRKWPHLKLYASRRGWEVLANPKAIAVIHESTLKVCERMRGNTDVLAPLDWRWRDDVQGESLTQGSAIDLGGRKIEFHETPGHSSCSISAYVPELRILFPSDAVAIPYQDDYVIAVGSSFEKYLESLKKLAGLDVATLCADHYGYVTGEEAAHYAAASQSAAAQMQGRLHMALKQEGSVDRAAARLVHLHFDQRPDYFVHPDILQRTYTQMLKQLA